jgi:hypothetical protein
MADIAAVFSWPPQAMDPMSVSDLMGWRERAAKRAQAAQTPKAGKR